MWIFRLIKKLFFLILFIVIVGIMMVVFFGSMWFNNNYDSSTWNSLLAAGTAPTGAIDQWFSAGAWFTSVTATGSVLSQIALFYVIPIGFALVFGIIIYTVFSILIHLFFKLFKRHRMKKRRARRDERSDYPRR